jgi:hypothetical protein
MIVTAEHREAAKQEASRCAHMSTRSIERLRATAESDAREAEANSIFAEKFAGMEHDMGRMLLLLKRISPMESWDERHAWKLRRCLANGWKVKEPHHVTFFARLTRDEETMSVNAFYREMMATWPQPEHFRDDGVKMGSCRAGKSCLRYEHRRPAPAPNGQFCSSNCRHSFLAVQKRAGGAANSYAHSREFSMNSILPQYSCRG